MIHSRSDADYQIFERLQQVRQDNEDLELLAVMRSLHFWTGKIVCCTVDTVLGFLANTYSGHLAWAALAQSMFVFDEIHSYDERLFGWLLEFLKTMRGSKILLMTASLPAHRLKAIEKVLAAQNETLGIVNGPQAWEEIKQYQRYTPAKSTVNTSATALAESHGTLCSPELAVQEAIASYQRGEKVLYICNTVGQAIGMALQIHEQMKRMNLVGDDTTASTNSSLIVYHSHFKYEDRVKRHKAIIAAFRKPGGVICVTTQVAEMSLDISADFLISELAPIAAMIQRLGRLNRRALTDSPRPFIVVALPIDSDGNRQLRPYSENTEPTVWFDEASEWLESLGDGALSQAALVGHWTDRKTPDSDEMKKTNWLLQCPEMTHDALRDSKTGCEVILAEDVETLRAAIKQGQAKAAYARLVIPMPPPPASVKKIVQKDPKYDCLIAKNRSRMTPMTIDNCLIGGVGDAALQFEVRCRADEEAETADALGCDVIRFRPMPWATQQKSRTETLSIDRLDSQVVEFYRRILGYFHPHVVTTEKIKKEGRGKNAVSETITENFWVDSVMRPFVADNLARRRLWFEGFARWLCSNEPASGQQYWKKIQLERKGRGLYKMVNDKSSWQQQGTPAGAEALVLAVQEALRRRYGAIANECKKSGAAVGNRFGGEYERWRLAFSGAKTAEQFRYSLTDMFSRAKNCPPLREHRKEIIDLMVGNWELARDLASYAKKEGDPDVEQDAEQNVAE